MKTKLTFQQEHPMKKFLFLSKISQKVLGILIACIVSLSSLFAANYNPEVVWVQFGPDSQNDTVVQGKVTTVRAQFKSASVARAFSVSFSVSGPFPGTFTTSLLDPGQNDGTQEWIQVNWDTKSASVGNYIATAWASNNRTPIVSCDVAKVVGFTSCASGTQGSLVLNHPNAKFSVEGIINDDTWPSDANPQWQRQKRGGQWEAVNLTDVSNSGNVSNGKAVEINNIYIC